MWVISWISPTTRRGRVQAPLAVDVLAFNDLGATWPSTDTRCVVVVFLDKVRCRDE